MGGCSGGTPLISYCLSSEGSKATPTRLMCACNWLGHMVRDLRATGLQIRVVEVWEKAGVDTHVEDICIS